MIDELGSPTQRKNPCLMFVSPRFRAKCKPALYVEVTTTTGSANKSTARVRGNTIGTIHRDPETGLWMSERNGKTRYYTNPLPAACDLLLTLDEAR